ncbi:BQ2448_892 [Microbotryum intermedium]|uniref:protein-tyrosine-phosphatase n=1 Tax=Microbotryum intermedium TaxID=269621 RepID=A0A238F9H7_9BASI|nr:BQ2448_892 [Microbotryum intermedium]
MHSAPSSYATHIPPTSTCSLSTPISTLTSTSDSASSLEGLASTATSTNTRALTSPPPPNQLCNKRRAPLSQPSSPQNVAKRAQVSPTTPPALRVLPRLLLTTLNAAATTAPSLAMSRRTPTSSPTRTTFAPTTPLSLSPRVGAISINGGSPERRASPTIKNSPLSGSKLSAAASPGRGALSLVSTSPRAPLALDLGSAAFTQNRIVSENTFQSDAMTDDAEPSLFVQPASPAIGADPIEPTISLPLRQTPSDPNSIAVPKGFSLPLGPPSPGGGLAARRMLNKKRLSLLVPGASSTAAGALSPLSPLENVAFGHLSLPEASEDEEAETRSLPPTPGVSLQSFIGPEGAEQEDRTIGRLMLADRLAMKQQADEMREQMRGGRNMKRRTSIPRLQLGGPGGASGSKPLLIVPKGIGNVPSSSSLSVSAGGSGSTSTSSSSSASTVQLLRKDNTERRGVNGADEPGEEYPYALGPREILPGIFLGSEQNARDPAVLAKWGFGFVLNVAKEVDCPWVDDAPMVAPPVERRSSAASVKFVEEEKVSFQAPTFSLARSLSEETPPRASTSTSTSTTGVDAPETVRSKSSHRRTKTQGVIFVPETSFPARPGFVRPTVSTPNLQSIFTASAVSPPNADISTALIEPTVAAAPLDLLTPAASPSMRRGSPRLRRKSQMDVDASPDGSIKFPSNPTSGRPEIDYLWLKWGHDESDLVEARKFQIAFDFLDRARASNGGKGRVLVHCQCGVSRSATVVIAYCMREAARALEEGRQLPELAGCTGMHDTYSFVKEKSEWVGPNLGLVFQLVGYERALRGDTGVRDDEEEPPFPDYAEERAAAEAKLAPWNSMQVESTSSPKTPISSHGSLTSGSHLSTPETIDWQNVPQSSAKPTAVPLGIDGSIASARPSLVIQQGIDDHNSSSLGQLTEAMHIDETFDEALMPEAGRKIFSPPPHTSFVQPVPGSNRTNGRPRKLPLNLDAARVSPTMTKPIASPSKLKPTLPRTVSATKLKGILNRFAFSDGASTDMSTSPSPATEVNSPRDPLPEGEPSTGTSLGGGKRPSFGTLQTPSERRMSHRRVFSDTIQVPASFLMSTREQTGS